MVLEKTYEHNIGLAYLFRDIYTNLEQTNQILKYFIDLCKAFDGISHMFIVEYFE